jgi:hypothetical protein
MNQEISAAVTVPLLLAPITDSHNGADASLGSLGVHLPCPPPQVMRMRTTLWEALRASEGVSDSDVGRDQLLLEVPVQHGGGAGAGLLLADSAVMELAAGLQEQGGRGVLRELRLHSEAASCSQGDCAAGGCVGGYGVS